ncbi:hypothetical protein ACH5RR_020561 [Cinchona calisaya]|uniref:Uncharacterized protein n=1 Tax=Cinchona calisaya TaxID=153742 RepID=A0ABD2ZHS8_9GENT
MLYNVTLCDCVIAYNLFVYLSVRQTNFNNSFVILIVLLLLGCRREIEFRRAGYNTELSAPSENIPFSTGSERERIEETIFRNKLTFFAAAKMSSSFPRLSFQRLHLQSVMEKKCMVQPVGNKEFSRYLVAFMLYAITGNKNIPDILTLELIADDGELKNWSRNLKSQPTADLYSDTGATTETVSKDNNSLNSNSPPLSSKVCGAIGKGFWTVVDMASGRYLWRNLVGSESSSSITKKSD